MKEWHPKGAHTQLRTDKNPIDLQHEGIKNSQETITKKISLRHGILLISGRQNQTGQ